MANGKKPTAAQIKKLRSRQWFDNPDNPDMTALYLRVATSTMRSPGRLPGKSSGS